MTLAKAQPEADPSSGGAKDAKEEDQKSFLCVLVRGVRRDDCYSYLVYLVCLVYLDYYDVLRRL